MSLWISIEHAPRDGTPVDLWTASGQRWTNCYWGVEHEGNIDMPHAGPKVEGWWCLADSWRYRIYPTHWMPVPKPPGGRL